MEKLESILQRAEVPAARIFTIADIFNDPHYRARQAIVAAPDDDFGSVAMASVVPRLSDTPGDVRHSGHRLVQDTRAVLRERLRFSEERIHARVTQGCTKSRAITTMPPGPEYSKQIPNPHFF